MLASLGVSRLCDDGVILDARGETGIKAVTVQPITDENASPLDLDPSVGGTGMDGITGRGMSAPVTL